jgi:hypothetical protein
MACWSGFFPCRVYIDSSCHDTLESSHSMFVVFGLEDVGYGYVIRIITVFTLPLALTSVIVLLVYACSSL